MLPPFPLPSVGGSHSFPKKRYSKNLTRKTLPSRLRLNLSFVSLVSGFFRVRTLATRTSRLRTLCIFCAVAAKPPPSLQRTDFHRILKCFEELQSGSCLAFRLQRGRLYRNATAAPHGFRLNHNPCQSFFCGLIKREGFCMHWHVLWDE